jgi:hypothetical protein
MPNQTDSIMVDELEWRGRFVNRAPNTTLIPLELRP